MALQADMQAIEESIQGHRRRFRCYEGMLKARNSQLEFLQEELKGARDLVQGKVTPRATNNVELERMAAEAMGSIATYRPTFCERVAPSLK